MAHRFAALAFTPRVRALQAADGSREAYARHDRGPPSHDRLGPAEAAFIAARDSLFMATVSETGWPYVQHRGGPPGFLVVLDERTIGFADLRGNRQYVSVGNLAGDDRVALILLDHVARRRLKLLGRARVVGAEEPELLARLGERAARGAVERGILIEIEALDWNCPQHIPRRFGEAELEAARAPLLARIGELEAALGTALGAAGREPATAPPRP